MRVPLFSKKRLVALVLCFVFVAPLAHAILPAFAAAWLISGTNMLITDIVMAQIGVISGWLWYECNGFTSIGACKATTPAIDPTAVDNAFGKKPIVVKLNPDSTRKNPDTKKWDNPANGGRDATPKATFPLAEALPGNGSLGAVASAGVGSYQYSQNNGTTVTQYDVIQTYQPGMVQTAADTAAKNSTASAHVGWSWSGGYFISANDWRAVWYKTVATPICPAGYSLSGTTCNLANATQVKKPASTTCEVLYSAGTQTFDFDTANPNCDGLKESLVSGKKLSSPSNSTGEKMSAEPTANGGFNICQTQQDGSWKCVQTGPYNPGTGGYPGQTGTSGTGGTPGDTGTGPGTGTGTGSGAGTGTGTGSSSGGSCGGASQVKCGIDDSGLDGKTADTDTSIAGVQAAHEGVLGAIQSHMPTAFSWNWAIPVQPVACSALSYNVLGMAFVIDWCKYVPMMQQAISFLAYCFTALHLFKIVTRPARR